MLVYARTEATHSFIKSRCSRRVSVFTMELAHVFHDALVKHIVY